MKAQRLKKLLSCDGESIGETLVALLISSLALLMLAGAITAATRVVTQSNTKMSDYYEADNALAQHTTGVRSTINISELNNKVPVQEYHVNSYSNNTFGRNVIYAYDNAVLNVGGEG